MERFISVLTALVPETGAAVTSVLFCFQSAEQRAASVSLCDGGGRPGPQEPPALGGGARGQLVRAVSQLPAGAAAGALPLTHLHSHTGEIHTGNTQWNLLGFYVTHQQKTVWNYEVEGNWCKFWLQLRKILNLVRFDGEPLKTSEFRFWIRFPLLKLWLGNLLTNLLMTALTFSVFVVNVL